MSPIPWGGCEVLGVLGSGAMGVVLKAVDPTLDRVVALKVMHPTLKACCWYPLYCGLFYNPDI